MILVLIGRQWAASLEDPLDWVRLELANAFRRNLLVIPVLVDGARFPGESELPPDLVSLATHPLIVDNLSFHQDVDRLVDAIRRSETVPESRVSAAAPRLLMWAGAAALLVVTLTVFAIMALRHPNPPPVTVSDSAMGNIVKAYAEFKSGSYQASIADLTHGLTLTGDPSLREQMYRSRAYTYVLVRDPELAIADYDQVLSLAPSDTNVKEYRDLLESIFKATVPNGYFFICKPVQNASEIPPAPLKVFSRFNGIQGITPVRQRPFVNLRGWGFPIPSNQLRYTHPEDAALAKQIVDALHASNIPVEGPVQMLPAEGRRRYIQFWLAWQ